MKAKPIEMSIKINKIYDVKNKNQQSTQREETESQELQISLKDCYNPIWRHQSEGFLLTFFFF